MTRRDIHETLDFFEYVRLNDDSVPAADASKIDVAILDMNHAWPNVGHNALVHAVLKACEPLHDEIVAAGLKIRVISFDVRRRMQIPQSPNGQFQLYVGTGGPGHLDPRQNDGAKPWAQGIEESHEWEMPLFRLFDDILHHDSAALLAVCHSFGLLCRWSGIAKPELRPEKSSGMPLNTLSWEATRHPWFSKFADQLPDHKHFRVIDNRLFDLVLQSSGKSCPLAFEAASRPALTMLEMAREARSGLPRVFGMNHHPEIIDREHIMMVLDLKRARGEVDDQWYRERAVTLTDLFQGETERQSRLTSHYTLLGPLRHHIERLVRER